VAPPDLFLIQFRKCRPDRPFLLARDTTARNLALAQTRKNAVGQSAHDRHREWSEHALSTFFTTAIDEGIFAKGKIHSCSYFSQEKFALYYQAVS
jgi:hypothetical protein